MEDSYLDQWHAPTLLEEVNQTIDFDSLGWLAQLGELLFSIQRSEFDSACRWGLLLCDDLFFKCVTSISLNYSLTQKRTMPSTGMKRSEFSLNSIAAKGICSPNKLVMLPSYIIRSTTTKKTNVATSESQAQLQTPV